MLFCSKFYLYIYYLKFLRFHATLIRNSPPLALIELVVLKSINDPFKADRLKYRKDCKY